MKKNHSFITNERVNIEKNIKNFGFFVVLIREYERYSQVNRVIRFKNC